MIALILAVVVAGLLVYVFTRPGEVHIDPRALNTGEADVHDVPPIHEPSGNEPTAWQIAYKKASPAERVAMLEALAKAAADAAAKDAKTPEPPQTA